MNSDGSGNGGVGGIANETLSGTLALTVNLTGGAGGASDGVGNVGGNAVSQLTYTNTDPSTLSATVNATGGKGGDVTDGTASGGNGGNVSGTAAAGIGATASALVTASATAIGGAGGIGSGVGHQGCDGGVADTTTATGSSLPSGLGNGAVTVNVTRIGGAGGAGIPVRMAAMVPHRRCHPARQASRPPARSIFRRSRRRGRAVRPIVSVAPVATAAMRARLCCASTRSRLCLSAERMRLPPQAVPAPAARTVAMAATQRLMLSRAAPSPGTTRRPMRRRLPGIGGSGTPNGTTGTANATAFSQAIGSGIAASQASADGASGQAQAQSVSTGSGFTTLTARATAPVASPVLVLTQTTIGGPVPTVPANFTTGAIQAYAFATGFPDRLSVQSTVLAANPNIAANIPSTPAATYYGAASLGVARASSGQLKTYDAMIDFSMPYSSLVAGEYLDVAFSNPTNFNAGAFGGSDTIKLIVTTNLPGFNTSPLAALLSGITTLAQLDALFSDQVFQLGGIANGLTGNFDLSFDLQMTTADPVGFAGNILLASVPEPASVFIFLVGLLIWIGYRVRMSRAPRGSLNQASSLTA